MQRHRRADISETDRLQTFTDAVVAIIATILIGPVARLESSQSESEDKDFGDTCNLSCYINKRGPAIAVYFLGFFLVCGLWSGFVRLFRSIRHTDDILLGLKLVTIGFMSFLPMVVSLMAMYPAESLSVYLTCLVIGLVAVMQLITVLYTFRKGSEELLHDDVDLSFTPKVLIATEIATLAVCIVVALVNIGNSTVAIALLLLIFVIPVVVKVFENIAKQGRINKELLPKDLFTETVDKFRLEIFSDGVFAIAATLIILESSTEVVPMKSEVKAHGFENEILEAWNSGVSYLIAFVMISMLWFVHHSVFNALQRVNILLHVINILSLSLVGVIPLVAKALLLHGGKADADDNRAVQVACIVLFGSGIGHFIMWTVAVCNRAKLLSRDVNSHKANEYYITAKTLVLPCASLVTLFVTWIGYTASYGTLCVMLLALPALFGILNWISSSSRFPGQAGIDETATEITATSDPM